MITSAQIPNRCWVLMFMPLAVLLSACSADTEPDVQAADSGLSVPVTTEQNGGEVISLTQPEIGSETISDNNNDTDDVTIDNASDTSEQALTGNYIDSDVDSDSSTDTQNSVGKEGENGVTDITDTVNTGDTDSHSVTDDTDDTANVDHSEAENSDTGTPNGNSGDDSTATVDSEENHATGNPTVPESPAPANPAAVLCEAESDVFRDTMLTIINESRSAARQCGSTDSPAVSELLWNEQLADAATNHARDMATVNFFSHTGSGGLSVADRADSTGYRWRAVGENIAAGQNNLSQAHLGWLDSPGHCRNIMSNNYTEVGAACVYGSESDYGNYWVVVFGDQF